MRFLRSLFLMFCALAGCSAWAQSVHWEPSTGRLSFNQFNELQLIFDDCEPAGDPALPQVPGLEMQAIGTSSNMTVSNGHISQSVSITVNVRATKHQPITIPAFSVATNKGNLQVAPATYQVGDATVGSSNLALNDVASGTIDVPKEVWAGEVFKLNYDLSVIRRYLYTPNGSRPEWDSSPLTVEDWGQRPDIVPINTGGEQRILFSFKTRAMARKPGEITLNPVTQTVNLTTGTTSYGFFAQPNLQPFTITSSRPTIKVKPLPENAPDSFKGAVGHFTFDSKVVPTTGAVGEPITWTLTLSGTGNWPDIPAMPPREVSRDFRVVQPQAHRTMKDNSLFEGSLSEDVVLIPTQPGNYTLGPLSWSYFDPAKGEYQTISTPKVVVTVSAPAAQPTPPPSANQNASSASPGASTSSPSEPVVAPSAPSPIPRDPLPAADLAPLPWNHRVFTIALLAPFPCLLLIWLVLALRRASATDPNRRLREAATRLQTIIDEIANARDGAGVHRGLQAWQRETAILWRFAPVVPRPQDFVSASLKNDATAKIWEQLWTESERVLYRSNEALPSDWVSRARDALQQKPAPSFSVLQLFQLKNLLPFAAAWLILALSVPHLVAAEISAAQSYREARFADAEKSWQTALQAHANDWSARHNLSLTLEQQSRWGEASAQAIAAFVQHPSDPAVRWNLAFAIDHAGFTPEVITGFVADSPIHSVARLLSPAEWQRAMVLASVLLAAGLLLMLLRFYAPFGRWSTYTGMIVVVAAALSLALGWAALSKYQETGDARAVIIWKPSLLRSIPTEVDAQQKTTPLAPGTIAIVDKTFLTWQRLSFPNGQTGWVRQEDVVKLWE